ncbi:hypothetical protein LINGRAHAP2_LOCUS15010 [Linum grandiflorum]
MRGFGFTEMRCATLMPSSKNESRPDPFTKSPDLRSIPCATYRTCRLRHWLAFTALTKFELQPELGVLSPMKFWNMFAWGSCVRVCLPALMSQVAFLILLAK